jgi:vesicle-associated membrane protein 72
VVVECTDSPAKQRWERMPLIYSFVSRGTTVLCEYTPYTGNFKTVATEVLQRVALQDKFTIVCDRHTFNFLQSNGFTYLGVADEAYGRQLPFAFCERIRDDFEDKYLTKGEAATENSLDSSFGPKLKSHMEYVTAHPEEISRIASVQKKVNEVKDVMIENIEKVRERGEKLDVLNEKADDLNSQADIFKSRGRALRNKMWWGRCKIYIFVAIAVLILAIVIFLVACYSGGNNCTAGEIKIPGVTPTPAPETATP